MIDLDEIERLAREARDTHNMSNKPCAARYITYAAFSAVATPATVLALVARLREVKLAAEECDRIMTDLLSVTEEREREITTLRARLRAADLLAAESGLFAIPRREGLVKALAAYRALTEEPTP